ncbi:uncharacterized protein LOC122935485 [Bufo gargarizans]|uniref:uncharacterized protein LOC122935485 n=1 Tax=Bufo gargarizans TaxID=30331 RepID=UPI001CF321E4|nr:uncharacterized protein LOC122935485 [Bufo gargarizans]
MPSFADADNQLKSNLEKYCGKGSQSTFNTCQSAQKRCKKRRAGRRHRKKSPLPVQAKEVTEDIQVINLSASIISSQQITVLQKGLSFSPTHHFNLYRTILDVNRFARNLTLRKHFRGEPLGDAPGSAVSSPLQASQDSDTHQDNVVPSLQRAPRDSGTSHDSATFSLQPIPRDLDTNYSSTVPSSQQAIRRFGINHGNAASSFQQVPANSVIEYGTDASCPQQASQNSDTNHGHNSRTFSTTCTDVFNKTRHS